MTELLSDIDTPSDAELIARVRGGDVAAYGELFSRHVQAARRLARQLDRGSDSDDLVSDAFAKVLTVLQGGGGPDVAFRAYLLTAVRRLHVDRVRAGSRLQTSDDMSQFDPGIPFQDTAVTAFDNGAAAKAFASLPERWQLVLWHLEVEGQKPADIAPLLGMSANSVSALAYRAREGLRQAFLTMHLSDISAEQCRWVNEHLGAYVRNGLAKRDAAKVDDHLRECRRCTAMYLELTEVNSNLKGIIAPLLLGAAATGYLTSTGSAGTAGVLAVLGRVRDLVLANASVAATGAAAAGVAAVATTTVVFVTHSGQTDTVTSADRPITATTRVVPSPGAGSPLPDVAPSAARPSSAVSPSAPVTTPVALTTPGALTSSSPGSPSVPGTVPPSVPSTGPGSVPGTGPASAPAQNPTAPGTTPAAPVTTPASQPSSPQPSHLPTPPQQPTPPQHSAPPPPSHQPTGGPTKQPTGQPSDGPTSQPTGKPTDQPTGKPTAQPTGSPTDLPSGDPSTPSGDGGQTQQPPPPPPTTDPGGNTGGGSGDSGGTTLPAINTLAPGFTFNAASGTATFTVNHLDSPTSAVLINMTSGGKFANLPNECSFARDASDGVLQNQVSCTPALAIMHGGTSAAQADVTAGDYSVNLPVSPEAGATHLMGQLSVDGYEGTYPWEAQLPPPSVDIAMNGLTPKAAPSGDRGIANFTGVVSGLTRGLPVSFTVTTDDPNDEGAASTNEASFVLPEGSKCASAGAANEITCTGLTDNGGVDLPIKLVDSNGDPVTGTVYVTVTPVGVPDSNMANNVASAAVEASSPTPTEGLQLSITPHLDNGGGVHRYDVTVTGAQSADLTFTLQGPDGDANGKSVVFDEDVPDVCTRLDDWTVTCQADQSGSFEGTFLIKKPKGQNAILTVSDGNEPSVSKSLDGP